MIEISRSLNRIIHSICRSFKWTFDSFVLFFIFFFRFIFVESQKGASLLTLLSQREKTNAIWFDLFTLLFCSYVRSHQRILISHFSPNDINTRPENYKSFLVFFLFYPPSSTSSLLLLVLLARSILKWWSNSFLHSSSISSSSLLNAFATWTWITYWDDSIKIYLKVFLFFALLLTVKKANTKKMEEINTKRRASVVRRTFWVLVLVAFLFGSKIWVSNKNLPDSWFLSVHVLSAAAQHKNEK